MVPPEAAFVALADQDDRWYPEKLAALLAGRGDAQLVYSDMRIVDETGRAISDTFWRGRRNNHTEPRLAAARQYRDRRGVPVSARGCSTWRSPSRPRSGTPSTTSGSPPSRSPPARSPISTDRCTTTCSTAKRHAGTMPRCGSGNPGRLLSLRHPRQSLREIAAHGQRSYETNVRRIALSAQTIEERTGRTLERRKARAVRRVARLGGLGSAGWLAARSLRRLAGRNETMGIELSLLAAVVWRQLAAARARLHRRPTPGKPV